MRHELLGLLGASVLLPALWGARGVERGKGRLMRGKWRATVGPQEWACRRCQRPLGVHDGQHLRLTGGELVRHGTEWGELVVRCTGPNCGAVWVFWPANVPGRHRGTIGLATTI